MNLKNGMVIEDAKANLYFSVGPKDKEGACRLDKHNCVVARAVKLQYPGLVDIEIGAHTAFVVLKDRKIRYLTTNAIRDGLNRFDQTGEWSLKKGVYHFLAPSRKQTRDALRARAKTRKTHPNKDVNGNRYAEHTGRCKKSSLNPRYVQSISKAARTAS